MHKNEKILAECELGGILVEKRKFIALILNELSHKESRLCVGVLLIVDTAKHLAKHFEQLNYCYTYEFYAKTILRCE